MEAESVASMMSMNLCPRCMMLFLAPKNEVFLKVTSLGDDYVMEFDNYQTEAIDDFQISDQM